MNTLLNREWARAALLGLVLGASSPAWAIGEYPGVVATELNLSSMPACTLCHQGPTAVGTVTTPFGASARARGMVFYNDASVRKALAALDTEKVDSDGDGMPDIEELKAGRDPNRVETTGSDGKPVVVDEGPPEPFYGCGAAPGGLAVGLLGLLGLLKRRR